GYMAAATGRSWADVADDLNRRSGLRGLCGESDMRKVIERAQAGDDDARLALDVYTYRVKKYIGAYLAVLGRCDAVVFTAGIGENSPVVRAASCAGLEALGISIDQDRNLAGGPLISGPESP